jgi:probable O-glycosylation ligase (exosortase A-associated)
MGANIQAVAVSLNGTGLCPRGAAAVAEPIDRRSDLLIAAVAGYILTAVGRVHQVFPVLEALRPAIVTGAVALVLFLVDRRMNRRLTTAWTPATAWLLGVFAWMSLSVPGALSEGMSVNLVFGTFIKTVLMCLVAAAAIRGRRDVERLVLAYLAGAAIYAAAIISRFELGSGHDDWRLGHLYYYDANDFATFAVTAIPFAVYFLHSARRLMARAAALAALAVLTLAFVYSGSRGGFLALAVVGVYVVLRYRAIPLRWRLMASALVAAVLLATASGQYWEQMGTIVSDADYNRTDERGRLQIWTRGIGYMLDNPLFGVGPSNFQRAEGTLSPFAERQQFGVGVRWSAAHNTFVQAGAELGIPGLLLFVAMIVAALRMLARAARARSPDTQALAQALLASLIGFVVGAFFLSLAYSDMLYTLVALAAGLTKIAAPKEAM